MMPSSMEFIFEWNSSSVAPSPMSHSVALSLPVIFLLPRCRYSTRRVRAFSGTTFSDLLGMSQ